MTLELQTPRLLLRAWRDQDLDPFAALCADPEVMRHFPGTLNRDEAAALIQRARDHAAEHGFGLWALERRDSGEFIGFTGLGKVGFEAPFTPATEIGWRLARAHWGQGYASEAARAALECAFDTLQLAQVVAFTVPANKASSAVMERIGMTRDEAGDFEHPKLPVGHPLRPHILYRIPRQAWLERP